LSDNEMSAYVKEIIFSTTLTQAHTHTHSHTHKQNKRTPIAYKGLM